MYKLRYGKTFNIGNYESARVEIEQDFEDSVPIKEAHDKLKAEVEALRPSVNQGYKKY